MESAKLRKIVLLAGAVAATAASAGSLPSDGLQAHFRADDAASVNFGNPGDWVLVTNWTASGACSLVMTNGVTAGDSPNYRLGAFTRADSTTRPGIRFGRKKDGSGRGKWTSYLKSTADTDLNLSTSASHWFMAWNHLNADASWRGVFGLYGSSAAGRRWDAALENSNTLVCRHGNNGYSSKIAGAGFYVSDSRYNPDDVCIVTYTNGVMAGQQSTACLAQTNAMPFVIGRHAGNSECNEMDIGELVIYNRALNDAEATLVREALAARWGAPGTMRYTGATAGFTEELVGVGASTSTSAGHIAGTVETSGDSDGLVVSVSSGSLDGTDGFVFAAHNSGAAVLAFDAASVKKLLARRWRIESTFATAPAATLTFDLDALGLSGLSQDVLATLSLVRKTGSDSAFSAVPGVTPVLAGGTAVFVFAAGALADGTYTLALPFAGRAAAATSLPVDGLQLQLRADDMASLNFGGAMVSTDAVTNWAASGAAEVELYHDGISVWEPRWWTGCFTRADGTKRPGVRFGRQLDGTTSTGKDGHYLTSRKNTYLGMTVDASSHWFFAWNQLAESEWKSMFGLYGSLTNGCCWEAKLENANQLVARHGASQAAYSELPGVGACLSDSRYAPANGNIQVFINGVASGTRSASCIAQTEALPFNLGRGDEHSGAPEMDVGELVIYNRALNNAEATIVREALAARWGVPKVDALYAGAAAGYTEELVGVGGSFGTSAFYDGVAETSGSCRGLSLAVTSGALDGVNGYVFAAADGEAEKGLKSVAGTNVRRLSETWRIEKSGFTTWPDVAILVDLTGYAIASRIAEVPGNAVLLRQNGDAFVVVPGVAPVYDAASGTLMFGCMSGILVDGVYTVGILDNSGLRVIIR